jgi:AraC-like DNA-binding protein
LQVHHINWREEKDLPQPYITCLANTEQNLYFYVNDPIKSVVAENVEIIAPQVVITGPKCKPVGLIFGKDHLMVKVAFSPTGLYRLLGIDMRQTINKGMDATSLWGNEAKAALDELRLCKSYEEMMHIVCAFLKIRVESGCRPKEPIDDVAHQMLDPSNDHKLEDWAAKACLSLRQFERNFTVRVGISPKLFIRIVRFEHAMRIKNESPDKSWAQIALECGYTDSSHLLREFREFAEFPPGGFYLKPTSGHSEFPTG